ncbi:TraB/GumN family protein [Sphingobium algorifonticola]|uniref:TraB/GumN family protein n=1 Tax=Sphingobium algorifonticola TaxID=2008318 RepID=A0A437J830_9SPHN|nr:TraB/GumN family protein [Sphingobium algorifonticola]RVT41146.1 TraB/GumN family protein [Sphingobium algorifonticola]
MNLPLKTALSALLLAAGAPALAQAPAPAPAPALVQADPALWVVKDEDTTIYLFGSVHVLKPGIMWFDDEVKAAFDKADTLVLEMVQPDQNEMMSKLTKIAIDPDGPPLSEKLEAAPRAAYVAAMTDNGLPWQALESFEPWMAGITLAVAPLGKLGYVEDAGVEKVLTKAAQAAGKPIVGLETADEQLGYFDTLPEAQQIAFLNATVAELPKMETEFGKLVDNWAKGETETLGEQMNASMEATPELARILLFNRNANWAKWIKARLDTPGTVFVAVGAGHLAGPKDVQDQLKALRVETARVKAADLGL